MGFIRLNSKIMNAFLDRSSSLIRCIPINRKVKGFFIRYSLVLKKYRFDFIFKCNRLGILWSSRGFPDLLTRHMLFEGMYQEDVITALQNIINKGDIVFDIGGHHGLMAIVSALATGNTGQVVAFEPNPFARKYLHYHLQLNGIANIIIEPIALSDKNGFIPFYVQTGDVTWNSSIIKEFTGEADNMDRIMVDTMTLDEFIAKNNLVPNIIKIDTEGSEFIILKGARETITVHKPFLIIECNPKSAEAARVNISDFIRLLEDELYDIFVLKRSLLGYYTFTRKEIFEENKHCKRGRLVNVICIPREFPATYAP